MSYGCICSKWAMVVCTQNELWLYVLKMSYCCMHSKWAMNVYAQNELWLYAHKMSYDCMCLKWVIVVCTQNELWMYMLKISYCCMYSKWVHWILNRNWIGFCWLKRVCRYQRSNQNPYIEEEQTTQCPKDFAFLIVAFVMLSAIFWIPNTLGGGKPGRTNWQATSQSFGKYLGITGVRPVVRSQRW